MSQNGQNTNLDLTTVESDDYDQLASRIESFYKADSAVKSQLAWNWERNHLMLDGKQWLTFEGSQATGGLWKPLRVSKQNEYIPRPVTNAMFDVYQTLKSYVIKNKPRSTVYPSTQSYNDRVSAKLATLCCEINWMRLREQQNYEYAAAVLVMYGTVFKKDFWDTTTINMVKVPQMRPQPVMDPNTSMPTGQVEQVPAVDENGDPITEELPLGDINTEVIEPYRICIDPLANDLHKARWIMEYSIQPLDWIKETYGKQDPGYTGQAEEVKEESQLSNSLRRFFNLKTSSGVRNNGMETASGQDTTIQNSAVVKEYYERPTQKYPKGRMIVVANGVTLYSSDSPYEGPEHGDWHPYSECRWEIVPGRFWGKSPLDEVVELQKRLNSIDSLIVLTRKTMAIPQKLIPVGQGITPGMWTGRPGQEVFFKDSGTGSKPELIPPSGVDAQVWQERQQVMEEIKEISGAIDILKGDKPPGVDSASGLNLLYEVGTGKLFPILDRWKNFVESSQKKQLMGIQKGYKEPRPEFIKALKAKNTELSEQEISKFIGSDLNDHCNVTVEAGSNIPKLQAAQQARLMELAQMGVLNLQMPMNREQFLQDMGVSGYDADIGPDKRRAEWENALLDNIVNSPDNKPIVLDSDDDDLHMAIHNARQKEPSFMTLPPDAQQAYMQHVMEHQQSQAKKQQAQILQAQATGAPPQPQPSANAPQPMHGAGKGISSQMKNQVFGADIKGGAPVK